MTDENAIKLFLNYLLYRESWKGRISIVQENVLKLKRQWKIMRLGIGKASNVVATAEAVSSLLRQNSGAHVAMKGFGQRQKIVNIKICLRGTEGDYIDRNICKNWKKIN